MIHPTPRFGIGKPQRPPPPPPMQEPSATAECREHQANDQQPIIYWLTVSNPPMPAPVTVRMIIAPDAQLCLTLHDHQSDASISAILRPDEVRDVRDLLANAAQPTTT